MDNARWMVILSVVVSMMLTLTLLNRYARSQRPETPVVVEETSQAAAPRAAEVRRPQVHHSSRGVIPTYHKVSFPKPAAHTFAVDQPKDAEKMKESLKVEGNLIR